MLLRWQLISGVASFKIMSFGQADILLHAALRYEAAKCFLLRNTEEKQWDAANNTVDGRNRRYFTSELLSPHPLNF